MFFGIAGCTTLLNFFFSTWHQVRFTKQRLGNRIELKTSKLRLKYKGKGYKNKDRRNKGDYPS